MRRLCATLGLLALVAAASPATGADSFGASYSPHPLIVEHWQPPRVHLTNTGDVPVSVALEFTEGEGYTLATETVELAPAEATDVGLVTIGTGEAVITATVTNAAAGMDRQVIVLQGSIRHQTPLEAFVRDYLPLATLPAVLAVLGGLYAILWRRRRRAER